MTVIGLGIDLVDVARAAALLERHGGRILDRLLLPAERQYVESMPVPARHFAARLAAKEAAYKALQLTPEARAIAWRDLEVVREPSGLPRLALHGQAAAVASSLGPLDLRLSLTHSDLSAAAVVIVSRS